MMATAQHDPAATGSQGGGALVPAAPGWTPTDLARDPHADANKAAKVRSMFAAIARSYDLNNRVHSLWQDQAWRRFAVRCAAVRPTDHVLDVACGTGDLTLAFSRAGAERVTGLDFTAEMLELARQKSTGAGGGAAIEYIQGDAQELPFAAASFDVVSIAFGIRNVASPARAFAEFRRVLRPGGRVIVLEFAEPRLAPVRWFNDVYCRRVMPVTATLISGDRSGAYRYLPKSVQTFMAPAELKAALERTGLTGVRDWSLSLGICRCYRAVLPG